MSSEFSSNGDDHEVRRADAADVGVLVDLMEEFYAESALSIDGEWARSAFERVFRNPELGCVWLARRRGVPAGHAVLTVRYTMEHGALSAYIDDLFVRREFRRRGIGRSILTELVNEARRRGCRSINVEVGSDNVTAIGLYEHFGLHPFGDGRVVLNGAL